MARVPNRTRPEARIRLAWAARIEGIAIRTKGSSRPDEHLGIEFADSPERLGVLAVVQEIRNHGCRLDGHFDEGEHDDGAQRVSKDAGNIIADRSLCWRQLVTADFRK